MTVLMQLSSAALLLGCILTQVNGNGNAIVVPSFSISDLQTGRRGQDLTRALTTTGLIAVTLDPQHDGNSSSSLKLNRHVALEGLCHCRHHLEALASTKLEETSMETTTLGDGQTTRTTLATATVGTTPLPLFDHAPLQDACGTDTLQAMEELRDHLATAAEAFTLGLDRLLLRSEGPGAHPPILKTHHGVRYSSVQDIVDASTHLEHFHVYTKKDNNKNMDASTTQDTLPLHTDAGLFLAFVPAHHCDDQHHDPSFFIQPGSNPQQQNRPVVFPPNSIAIMLGAGAEQWLDTPQLPLRATRHAVRMEPGTVRAWYGMMHLVPESAIIQHHPKERTFGDMKKSMALLSSVGSKDNDETSTQDDISIGCGMVNDMSESFDTMSVKPASPRRRRLQHVQDPSACNNSTNFFCWMQCLDIPNHQQAVGYITEGYSLYCLDPAILAASGNRVSEATGPCENGWVHNANCLGSWQPTAPGLYSQQVDVETPSVEEQFCYGGTSMYMDGFHWLDSTCVILLFPAWVLSSGGRLAVACLGMLAFGVALELVIRQRRTHISSMAAGYKRLMASGVSYGVQLTMGYFLMLAVMTYSGPLFLCSVFGLVFGHVMFNARDALLLRKQEEEETTERNKLEESSEELGAARRTTSACCGDSGYSKVRASTSSVPEGSTPCCQHTL